jgi:hypothetical protein
LQNYLADDFKFPNEEVNDRTLRNVFLEYWELYVGDLENILIDLAKSQVDKKYLQALWFAIMHNFDDFHHTLTKLNVLTMSNFQEICQLLEHHTWCARVNITDVWNLIKYRQQGHFHTHMKDWDMITGANLILEDSILKFGRPYVKHKWEFKEFEPLWMKDLDAIFPGMSKTGHTTQGSLSSEQLNLSGRISPKMSPLTLEGVKKYQVSSSFYMSSGKDEVGSKLVTYRSLLNHINYKSLRMVNALYQSWIQTILFVASVVAGLLRLYDGGYFLGLSLLSGVILALSITLSWFSATNTMEIRMKIIRSHITKMLLMQSYLINITIVGLIVTKQSSIKTTPLSEPTSGKTPEVERGSVSQIDRSKRRRSEDVIGAEVAGPTPVPSLIGMMRGNDDSVIKGQSQSSLLNG